MKIALIGYGKMGKTIEKLAQREGHKIVAKIDVEKESEWKKAFNEADVAIEFTQPESAYENLKKCIENQLPVVSGTTGWLEKKPEIAKLCKEKEGAFFYASNFSIGVNLFFKINEYVAQLFKKHLDYQVHIEETHHTEKKDAPSGTAISLAEGIINNDPQRNEWVLGLAKEEKDIPIYAFRQPAAFGNHSVKYASTIDTIEINHTANSREGFAMGAIRASEWLIDKKGVFGMEDFLKDELQP